MNWAPLAGAAQLALGRGAGIARFSDSPQAFLASLAPLVAFPLVGAAVLALSGNGLEAATTLLLTMVAQLAPAVLSHALAVRWHREDDWLRYATAFNWCQWAIPAVAFLLLVALQFAVGGGMRDSTAATVLVGGLALYGIWLHWIVARHGLDLSRWRAALLVALVNAGTLALVLGPRLLQTLAQAGSNGSDG